MKFQLVIKKWFVIGLLFIMAGSCTTVYETISNRNFSDAYNPGAVQIHPQYELYQHAADELRLYFRLFPKEFSYKTTKNDTLPHANISLFFRVTETEHSIEILASLTKEFKLRNKIRPDYMGFLPVKLPKDGSYVMEVFVTDRFSKSVNSKVISFNYQKKGSSLSFLMLSQHGNPLFYPYFDVNDTVRIRTEMLANNPIQVSYYPLDTMLPKDPDVNFKYQAENSPDTSWIIDHPDTSLLFFEKPGVYFFSNREGDIGKSYLCGNAFFPYVKTASELLRSLSYLTTNKEMEKLRKFESAKTAVDSFWIERAEGEHNRARELIRVYYNRVQLANYFFTDFKEGFLTDRGMIYIICGAPAFVRIADSGEYWTYGRVGKNALEFYFSKVQHPVSGRAYYLDRSELYSRLWYTAIKSWREGRVFSLNP